MQLMPAAVAAAGATCEEALGALCDDDEDTADIMEQVFDHLDTHGAPMPAAIDEVLAYQGAVMEALLSMQEHPAGLPRRRGRRRALPPDRQPGAGPLPHRDAGQGQARGIHPGDLPRGRSPLQTWCYA